MITSSPTMRGRSYGAVAFGVLSVFLFACQSRPVLVEPADVVTVASDAGDPSCARACANLRALDCPEGEPSPGGITCEAVCFQAAAHLDVKCIASAKAGSELGACNVRCIR